PEVHRVAGAAGFRDVLALAQDEPTPPGRIGAVKMGTTVATNALLERKGERTLLLVTKGFRDALRIGYQARPNIFARHIIKPEMLYERVIEVDERVRADGTVQQAPNLVPLRPELERAKADGLSAVAIVFMHAYRYPTHEQCVEALVRELGFPQVSASHVVSPLIKLVSRGDTTVVDAYLSPILRRYVWQVSEALGAGSGSESAYSRSKIAMAGATASPLPFGEREQAASGSTSASFRRGVASSRRRIAMAGPATSPLPSGERDRVRGATNSEAGVPPLPKGE